MSLFPLALSPNTDVLREVGTGVLWVSSLLSSLLALEGLFRGDADDGSLEQLMLSPVPLGITVLAKVAAHWLVAIVPLIALVPVLALSYALPLAALPTMVAALLLATPTLSVLIALGAALTVSLRRGGSIVGLLILPMTAPLLIFGSRATDFGVHGEPTAGPLYLLAALAALRGRTRAGRDRRGASSGRRIGGEMRLPRWFHLLGSPPFVYGFAGKLAPWLGGARCLLLAIGAYWGLAVAPPDRVQGEVYRILFIHPQTAYVGMMAYVVMAVAGGIGYIWRIKLAHAVAVTAAPIGASFAVCALATGAIWGRPTWGTYWQWSDPRIMSETLLLFLFLGYLALRAAFDDRDKADRVSAILAVVGVVNVPVIQYSVEWWNTLHQGPSISKLGAPLDRARNAQSVL